MIAFRGSTMVAREILYSTSSGTVLTDGRQQDVKLPHAHLALVEQDQMKADT